MSAEGLFRRFAIQFVRLDFPLSAQLFGFARFPQTFRRAVGGAVACRLCFVTRALLRFSHTPQVYDIAHAVFIHNSDF